jgi:hypothetical protein
MMMNNTNQNHTDNFFKQGLSSPPEFSPSETNWKEMERLLRPEAKRRPMAWIYAASGIAAALLIFLSLWLFQDKTTSETQRPEMVKLPQEVDRPGNQATSGSQPAPSSDLDASAERLPGVANEMSLNAARRIASMGIKNKDINPNAGLAAGLIVTDQSSLFTSVANARYVAVKTTPGEPAIQKLNVRGDSVNALVKKKRSSEIESLVVPGKWALSLALSPDVNSVKGIDNGEFGMSFGMGVSYRVGKALSISTGIYYSKKLYSADKTSYKVTEKPFATWTSYSKQIDADCRVIDVPVNVSLRLSNKTQNKLYATAGMSSYVMLSEKYDFIYNGPSPAFPTGRREYTLRNENKHLLSVVNLGVALERPLSDQVSLVVQPYAKLPLTGIGQGETDLKSFGVGFKLNYSLKK